MQLQQKHICVMDSGEATVSICHDACTSVVLTVSGCTDVLTQTVLACLTVYRLQCLHALSIVHDTMHMCHLWVLFK